MPVLELYSERLQREQGGLPDVYNYGLPKNLRVQIVLIWRDVIGRLTSFDISRTTEVYRIWDEIASDIRKARCVFNLPTPSPRNSQDIEWEVAEYFMAESDPIFALNVVEAVFGFIYRYEVLVRLRADQDRRMQDPQEGIAELNARFRQHGVGYQFENGRIIRVDSMIVHAEVVKPVLGLLTDPAFKGPEKEFLAAHEHYRHARYAESLVSSLKALEGTIRVIGRDWGIDDKATASKLIAMVFEKGLIPNEMQSEFTGLRAILESASTLRNRWGGHHPPEVREVPAYLAAFALHTTAANILLLVEAQKATKP